MRAEILRRVRSPLAISTAVAIVALGTPGAAAAFCRTTTVPVPASWSAGDMCFTQGEPLYHPSQCVTYKVATAEVGPVKGRVLADSIGKAFATWSAPNIFCLPGISVVQVGTVEGPVQVGYTANAPGSNSNVIGFVAGAWPHGTEGDTLALTTLTFRADDGRILDVDTEINRDVRWSAARPFTPEEYDLDTAMLHEAGHFLGLAHSSESTAAMFPSYTVGSFLSKLDNDDLGGICAVYPSRDARNTRGGQVASTACQLQPDTGAGSSCGEPNIAHGCGVTPLARTSNDASWWIAATGLALSALAIGRLRARLRARKSF